MKRFMPAWPLLLLGLCGPPQPAWSLDEKAARNLAKENNCFRCHAMEREKNGPSWSSISTKYKLQPNGAEQLMAHLTLAPKIKLLEEGTEVEHKIVKSPDKHALQNLVKWILSL
jgi:cytochrome c